MKYIKEFKIFESSDVVNDYIQDVQDVLQDLIDDDWVVDISYTPKRWENPRANYHIKSDHISVDIRRMKCRSGSIYPSDSEFKASDISDYTLRIVDMFKDHEIEFQICLALELNDYDKMFAKNPLSGESEPERRVDKRKRMRDEIKIAKKASRYESGSLGKWCDANIDYLSDNTYDINGIILKIYLDGENLDLKGKSLFRVVQ